MRINVNGNYKTKAFNACVIKIPVQISFLRKNDPH